MIPQPAPPMRNIPAKVEAAQQYLYYAQHIRVPPSGPLSCSGDMPTDLGELSSREQATYDAALDVLISYFRGEMDFGDKDPGSTPDPSDDDPKNPVPSFH